MMPLFAGIFTAIGFVAGFAMAGDFPFWEAAFASTFGSIVTGLVSGLAVSLLSGFVAWKHNSYSNFISQIFTNLRLICYDEIFALLSAEHEWNKRRMNYHSMIEQMRSAGIHLKLYGFEPDGDTIIILANDMLKCLSNNDRRCFFDTAKTGMSDVIKMKPSITFISTTLVLRAFKVIISKN